MSKDDKLKAAMQVSELRDNAAANSASGSILIVIPTYNERDNIGVLVPRLREIVPQANILIVDDDSPDGTSDAADALARAHPHSVFVLHRAGKNGLGRAYVAGLGWGVARGYDWLVQMDADLSHDPRAVLRLVGRAQGQTGDSLGQEYDLILGSRYVSGGETRNWCLSRRCLSRFGSASARCLLRLPFRDLTGGFKCWRRATLQSIDLNTISAHGYAFQIETTYRAARHGASVAEEPIVFTERQTGCSKMNRAIAWEALTLVLRLWRDERRRVSGNVGLAVPFLRRGDLRRVLYGPADHWPNAKRGFLWATSEYKTCGSAVARAASI